MKTFFQIREARVKKLNLDFDMGDPREFSPDWQEEGVFLTNWNKRKMEMTVEGEPKALEKWLVGTYGYDKKEAKAAMRTAK
jgi:hypothetical protein